MTGSILVIDDTPLNLKLTRTILQREGYTVYTAPNAEQALTLLETTSVDLIFMDLQMPGMDGFTLTRRLKTQAKTKHIPIVALTSYAMRGDEERARAIGCDGYVTKPVNTRTLAALVESYLKK
jgi:CheY-like chemotaxis protein